MPTGRTSARAARGATAPRAPRTARPTRPTPGPASPRAAARPGEPWAGGHRGTRAVKLADEAMPAPAEGLESRLVSRWRAAEHQRGGSAATAAAPWTDEVRDEAIGAFRERHPGLALAPVVAVVAALDEEASIGEVLAAIPARAC